MLFLRVRMTAIELLHQAFAHHQAGRADEAESLYRQALAADPQLADAWYLLGALAMQRGEAVRAAEHIQKAIALRPERVDYHTNLAMTLQSLGRVEEAISCHLQAAHLQPDDSSVHYQLGIAQHQLGQVEAARRSYERAIELRPDFADAHNSLGNLLAAQQLVEEAIAAFEQAIVCASEQTQARYNLAGMLQSHGRDARAIELYEQVLQRDPRHLPSLRNLGAALQDTGRYDDARTCYRRALELEPDFAEVWSNLGTLEQKQGELSSALECYRRALQLNPQSAEAGSNLLLCSAHDPDITPQFLYEAHRDWGQRHTRLVPPPPYTNIRVADRPLRVGYVSADFVRHPVMRFFISIVENHNPAIVQAFHYSQVRTPDKVTATLERLSSGWRPILHLSDDQVFKLIREDEIDILVDLSGHTAGHRLQVFARRPAPISVTYLGYPTTTGVPAITYRLTDSVIDPPGEGIRSVESLWRLPGCFTALAPLVNVPDVGPPPVQRTGVITFGSFHKLLKLNTGVIDAWCRLLQAAPGSRLLVLRDTLVGAVRDRLVKKFADRGIDAARLDVRSSAGSGGHLSVYGEVDISLDTFPWSGHTTACESLWMGVPMLTLRSEHHAGRMVASVLECLGLHEWVAESTHEYVEKAVQFAGSLGMLSALRSTLRQRVLMSPLCDGKSFTARLEQDYREMWRRYLGSSL